MSNIKYIINDSVDLNVFRGCALQMDHILAALEFTHKTMEQFASFEVDVFSLLGMRNLSAFVGEVVAASLIKTTNPMYKKNPHQDGYPDLLLMDSVGLSNWARLEQRLRDKKPFSPFETGGIEVKATCGSVPTPEKFLAKGIEKPDIGDQRIEYLMGYDWKAHHRETNNLFAVLWDFIDRKPIITAAFYCNSLTVEDWGVIVQPKEGGGRTTSVSIMTKEGVNKMYRHWVAVIDDDRYKKFLNRRNKGNIIPCAFNLNNR